MAFEIRELNKVYTNGTLVDGEFLTDEQAGHCVSIAESAIEDDAQKTDSERKFGICILDCSTSEFNLSSFEDDICRTKLETLMRQICPKEIVCKKVRKDFPFSMTLIDLLFAGYSFNQHSAIIEDHLTFQLPLDIPSRRRGSRIRRNIGGAQGHVPRHIRRRCSDGRR